MLENLYNSLKYAGKYTQFLDILEIAGYVEKLKSFDEFTVFAPSDESIKNIDTKFIDLIYKDAQKIDQIASSHIIPGKFNINSISSMQVLSYENIYVYVKKIDSDIYINNAKIISYDHEATNGIYHEVDNLIIHKEKI